MTIMQRLLLIVILAAVPIGLLQALSVRDEQREESAEVTQMALGIAQRAAAEQRRITEGARHLLMALAQLPAVRERDRSCSVIMRRLREQFEIYTVIGVADSAGRVWCSTAEPGTEVGDRPYFRHAVSSGEFTTGGYVIGRATGKRTLNFSLPYFDDTGKLLGVLITGLDLDRLASDLGSAKLPSASDVAIFGPDRHLLVHLPGGKDAGTGMPASFEAAFDATSPLLAEMTWLDGSDRLVALIPPTADGDMPFLIAVGVSRTEALGRVETSARHGFLVLLSVVVGGILLAWWFASRYVRRPVQQLAATVRAWREGDPHARVGPLHPGSEFDDLARAFDAMADTVEERKRRLQDAMESTTDIVTALAPDWTITFLNRHATAIINGEEVVGKKLWDAFPELLDLSLGDALKSAMTERRKVSATFEYERLGAHFETSAFPAYDGGLILYSRNVTEAVRAQEALRKLALFDPLTGLPNRSQAMKIAKDKAAQGQLSALLLLDLDGFKHINDSFGHPVGDEMLRDVAQRLSSCVGNHGVTARLGGDEFIALLFEMPAEDCLDLAGKILRAVESEPFLLRGHVHRATTSCGIVIADATDGPSVEELMANADIALYRAKAAGGGVWRAYDVADRDAYEARQRLEAEVALAATSGQFELYYQPQVRLEDGTLVGAEALLRWRHPERGLLLPDAFIDVLDTSRHAAALGDWIIEEACQQAARWWRAGRRLRVSVNIFSQQLRSGDLPRLVKQVLTRHNLPPEALELELTERIALEDEAGAKSTLQMLSLLGVRLAFDDFGTGFASLTTLKDLPVNRIKIDRAFVTHLPTSEHDQAIVEAVLALARTLDMDVVAEGVETAAQEAYLRSSGCQEAQGFRYARPMSASAFNAHILSASDKAAAG